MLNINGTLMNSEREIGIIDNGILSSYDEKLIPLFLKRTRNIEEWLGTRSADPSRSNIRKLKSVFDIEADIDCVLSVNAMTITDRYWIRFNDEEYEDIRFKIDDYCNLALKGVDLLELLSLQKSEALRSAGNLLMISGGFISAVISLNFSLNCL